MNNNPSWLPTLFTLSSCSGDIIYYTDKLYEIFLNDLVNGNLTLSNKKIIISSKLENDGRHERFWHTITDPHNPSISDIKLERAEKLPWIKPIIINVPKTEILIYERTKNNEKRLYLLLPNSNYIVVLSVKKQSYYYVTAFHIDYSYKIAEYKKEYEKYK